MPGSAPLPTLRDLPSVDRLLNTAVGIELRSAVGTKRLTAAARLVTDELREEIRQGRWTMLESSDPRQQLLALAVKRLQKVCEREELGRIRRVINATGVILHTNLGRAPLSKLAQEAILKEAAGYCTLEYDAVSGKRGRRGASVERLLTQITSAEDALVVNNCAAAALLILKVLASGGETIVSRGELVEIGGDFRVPDVMANSGTRMVEVGSTNRTRLEDYRRAITDKTRLLMHVHPSNYRIVGFTSSPSLTELAECAHEANLPFYVDAGSGALVDLSHYGLHDEPLIRDCIEQGADVVSFSGDKLVGATQAGLIVGSSQVVDRLRKHSLYRALRADKLCLAALEATLNSHLSGRSFAEVPALEMLAMGPEELEGRARNILTALKSASSLLMAELVTGESAIGGGSGPDVHPPTKLIAVTHQSLSTSALEEALRASNPPVVARVAEDKVLIDLRTVHPDEEDQLLSILVTAGSAK